MNCTMNRNCNCSGNTMSCCGRSCNMSGGNRPNNMSGFGCSNNATQGCGCSNNTTQSCGPLGNNSNNMSRNGSANSSNNCSCMNNNRNMTANGNSRNSSSGNICGCKRAGGCGCMKTDGCDIGTEHVDHMAPGMCYVPWQKWEDIYSPEEGFARGTIFAQLDKSYIGRKCK